MFQAPLPLNAEDVVAIVPDADQEDNYPQVRKCYSIMLLQFDFI